MVAGRVRGRQGGVSVEIVIDKGVFNVIEKFVLVFVACNNDIPRKVKMHTAAIGHFTDCSNSLGPVTCKWKRYSLCIKMMNLPVAFYGHYARTLKQWYRKPSNDFD